MKKLKLKRMLSLILAMSIMLTTLNGISFPVTAAEASSGTDENGFSWTSDGTSVTITGYNPSKDSSLFYGIQYNGHYYGLSVSTKTWSEAKADCEANGGHLVTIADEAEQKIVQDLFSYDSSTTAWIGATDETTEGEWTWCTGEEFSYTNWNSGEPNNDNEEDYAGIYIDNFKWNDWGSSQKLKYICEWEELPPEDIFSEYKFYGLEYNGHYYGLSQNKLSWEAAKVSCESVGGQLVSINDENEQALISRLLGFAPSGNRWIGAYKADGLWQWVDGEVLGYTNWDPGEPNGNADTAHIYYSNHRWDDASGTMYYICEWTEEPSEAHFKSCVSDIVIPEKINGLPVTAIGGSVFKNNKTISSVNIPDTVTSIGTYAFSGCSSIKTLELSKELTTIGSNAFNGCTGLTNLTIPENVTTIGSYAFSGCVGITEFSLPEGLTSLGAYAFNGCTGMTEITLPESLTSMGRYVFNGTNITEIVIPASVTTMGDKDGYSGNQYHRSALCGANSLTKVVFAEGRTSLPFGALRYCTQVTDVELPEGLTSTSTYSFSQCTALTSIELPSTLVSIGNSSFEGCSIILSIDIPNTVTTIGSYAFSGCAGITEFSLPEGLTSLGAYAFNGCTGMTEITLPESLTNMGRNVFNGTNITEIVIPASVTTMGDKDGYSSNHYHRSALCGANSLTKVVFAEGRTSLPFGALRYCTQVTDVELPEGLTSTSTYSFSQCTALTSIELPSTLVSIGSNSFENCTNLSDVSMPDVLQTIGSSAFSGCTALTEFTMPTGLTTIGSYAFSGCAGITEFSLPEGLTSLGAYAFNGCTGMTEITLPESLTNMGRNVFNGTNITEIVIPASVTTMGDKDGYSSNHYHRSALCGANSLTKVVFAEGRTSLPFGALRYCTQVTDVELPEGLTSTSTYSFSQCTALTSIDLPSTLVSIGSNSFENCTNLSDVSMPDVLQTIGSSAFSGCTALTEFTMPTGLTTIGSYAFSGCAGITEFSLPEGLTSLGAYAFNGCTGMTEITLPESLTNMGRNVFNGTNITEIVIPASVTTMGDKDGYSSNHYHRSALCGANSLTKVVFAEGRTSLPFGALRYCTQVTDVELPEGLTSTSTYSFSQCTALTSIDLPSTLVSIGSNSFENCTNLSDVNMPNTVQTISSSAFSGCSALTEFTMPTSLTTLGSYAFSGCSGITEIILPEKLTNMGRYVFNGTNITEIVIPASVTTMGDKDGYSSNHYHRSALCGANSLTKVVFAEGRTSLPFGALRYCTQVTDVELPEGLTSTSTYSFSQCTALTSIELPSTVTTIGTYSFENCTGISNITVPSSVQSIGNYAFNGCSNMTVVTINAGNMFTTSKIEAENTNITSGNPKWASSNASGGYCVDYAYDLDFDVNVARAGTFQLSEYACYNNRSFKLYVDDVLVGTITPNGSNSSTITKYNIATLELSEGEHNIRIKQNSGYTPIFDYFIIEPVDVASGEIVNGEAAVYYDGLTSIGTNAFTNTTITDVYYTGTEEQWNTVSISSGNDPLINATFHFAHTHIFGEWEVDYEPTCVNEGKKHKTCVDCEYAAYESIEKVAHTYELEVVPPTYLEQGYTLYTCSVCGDTYKDTYVDPLTRIDLSNATLELEYTSAYYEGLALTPDVTLTYEGETFDSSKELKITYTNNNQVGTATVIIEGINRFEGTVELQFEISYEVIPEQIVNVIAIGEIGKVSLSWGESSEVNTDSYNIYRKADGETEYQLIKTINGRTVLSYEDKSVEKSKTYSYYVTGIGLYGAESEPSLIVTATVLVDEVAPTVLKVSPAAASVISGETTLSATATDNIGVTKIAYFYTLDNGENWVAIGETTNKAFSIVFDTSDLGSESVKVKAVAYDAEGNESDPITVVYSLDNVGPEKVTGLSAVTLSSKITLSWNDVTANDAAYFILQTKSGEEWTTVAKKITTLGYTITGLQPDTDYIYRVACVDTHGNIGEYSDEFTARTAVDETAPVITSQSPNSARYNSTIKFSATAKDDCDVETIEIQVSTDLSSWTTISTNTYTTRTYKQTYTYTIDLSSYAEGSIFVRAIATDFSGNISDTSDAAPYTEYIVDKTAPEAPTGISANGNDGYITVSWTMGNEGDLGKYFVYKSTSLDGNYQLIASNLSTLNYHDRNVQSGREFYYKVKVSDSCGNMSEYSNAASATMSPDTQSPEITSISSTYQQKISNSSHTINVAANDNNKLSYIVVEYCTSINPEYTQLVVSENIDNHYKSISVTLPIDGLTDGDVIHLRAYAVDMAGLQSEYATAKYTLDTTPPMVEDYTALLDVSTVYLDWKDNGESDLSGFKVYRSVDGETFTLLGSRGVSSTGAYSFIDTITDKESNTYIYKLESIDRLGNTASWLKSVDYTYVYVNQIPIAQMVIPDFMTVGVEEIFDASGSTDDIVIMSYLWDFGDGTTSTEMKPVKSYDAVGTYTVKLSVTDNEGITSTITKDIEVKERDLLGTLNVKVVDENGKALSYVPVYFDLGSNNQKIIYTNASGVATLQMLSGTHTIGMYASGYLPVKKDVVVLANATRTVTLTTVEEDIVTGNFEITRMTFDEIVAAGIDVYDPANQNVYSATVRVTYGSTPPLTINYVRNDDKIISYTVKDSNGNPVTHYTNSNGESRKITGITYIPSSQGGSDVVAIMDIPAEASYLKEFFDVRLHIVNNASSEFTLEMNEVVLNVPEGMTLMTSVSGDYSSSNTVKIDAIKGQETVTLAWVLRGDKAGEYALSADFTGTLAEFNELVTARFETEEPIKVYGLEGVKFRILTADEIHNDTLYFNIELENERDIDIYMPSIGLTDKIANVTESVLNDNAEGDFFTEAYILNAYIQTENGQKQYVPVTYDANGRATTAIETLAPGQKIVYEYVAYNAINYDGIAYFKEAAITEFEGVIDNIETGSFHKELYSFTDYSAKLDAILSGSDADVNAAFDYINTNGNYYYVSEAEDSLTNVCQVLYSLTDLALNADISVFTQEEERQLIEQIILSILADSSSVQMAEELQAMKYLGSVRNIIGQTKNGLISKSVSGDLNGIFNEILGDSKELTSTYMLEGEDAFYNALYTKLSEKAATYSLSLVFDGQVEAFFNDIGISETEAFSSTLISPAAFANSVLDALDKTQRQAYVAAVLKMECNAEYSNYVLDAIISNASNSGMSSLIIDVATDLKQQINESKQEYYDYAGQFYANLGTEIGEMALKSLLKAAISATPLSLAGKIFAPINTIFNFDSFYKQQDALDVYNAMSKTLIAAFDDTVDTRDEDTDFYSMCILKALCELRLSGEAEFKSFMNDYMEGKYALPLSEETVLKQINGVMNTSYTSIDEWYDDVQYNIVHSRDILFNVEGISELETPRAPVVTLDYDKLQTVQTFTSEYEYCFADGVWRDCSNEPITFEVGVTPSVLRVRKAASDTNFVGEITTVKIFARKDLSKLITAKFDGVNYLLDNLSAKYNYQVIFTNDLEATVDWSAAQTIAGSDSTVKISGVGEYSNIIIRSCQNADLYETTSNPLSLTVSKKKPLNLVIDGSGTVTQTADSGCYFNGESIDLIATANAGCSFIGWYIDDVCVSTDEHYIVEMVDGLEVVAQFTGVKIKGISIEELPTKLNYYEGESLDLNGMKVLVTYSDDTTAYAEQFAAQLSSNTVGKSTVVITYGGYSTSYDVTISHNESVWITTVNATMFNEGLKVKRCSVCHKVVETEVLSMLVDESGIIVDPNEYLIYNIPEYLFTSDAIITHYDDLGCRVKILDATSKTSTCVMTGGYVMYAGTKYSAIIFGDTTGDGEIDIFDILGMLDHVNGDTELEGVYEKAGLVVNEEEIDIFDTLAVLDHVNGDASINP